MKLLFICNQGKHRSKTAELLFRTKYETQSAGLYNNTPITKEQLEWADIVFVMEDFQRTEIARRYPKEYLTKQILCLDIPDQFSFNQRELVQLLNEKISLLLAPLPELN